MPSSLGEVLFRSAVRHTALALFTGGLGNVFALAVDAMDLSDVLDAHDAINSAHSASSVRSYTFVSGSIRTTNNTIARPSSVWRPTAWGSWVQWCKYLRRRPRESEECKLLIYFVSTGAWLGTLI